MLRTVSEAPRAHEENGLSPTNNAGSGLIPFNWEIARWGQIGADGDEGNFSLPRLQVGRAYLPLSVHYPALSAKVSNLAKRPVPSAGRRFQTALGHANPLSIISEYFLEPDAGTVKVHDHCISMAVDT
jgi:hypothetical protein